VHLTGVRSLKDADELSGQTIYADYFEEESGEDLTGWTVHTPEGEFVGTVSDYEDIPGNTCLWVRRPDGTEVLLPFHEDLVVSLDAATSRLTLHIPDGLL
jgi:16S rRNA processing protein RimM